MPPAPLQTSATAAEASPSVEAAVEEETVMDAFERRAKSLMSSLGTNLCGSSFRKLRMRMSLSGPGKAAEWKNPSKEGHKSCLVFGLVNR